MQVFLANILLNVTKLFHFEQQLCRALAVYLLDSGLRFSSRVKFLDMCHPVLAHFENHLLNGI